MTLLPISILRLCLPGLLLSSAANSPAVTLPRTVLARVEVAGPVKDFQLPAHAILQAPSGTDYLLVFAEESELRRISWPWRVLGRGLAPEDCIIATEMRQGARDSAGTRFLPLLEEGATWVLAVTEDEAAELAELGFALQRISPEPITWSGPPGGPAEGPQPDAAPDPLVSRMIGSVQATNLHSLLARLTGAEQVLAGGAPRWITTRHTSSGLPLTNALDFAWHRLQALNLAPFFHHWTVSSTRNRNLVANLPGTARSNELVLVTAHLDDMPAGSKAPGADDNATGNAGVLMAAAVCSQYKFERTLRFVLFTGEEQGLYGSQRYAAAMQQAGEKVVGVLNLDMLGWNNAGGPVFSIYTRTKSNPGFTNDLALFRVFTNVVTAYGLSAALWPKLAATGLPASDHASFWSRGYPAVLAIEDAADSTPYYHTTSDTAARVNLPYYTTAVRACIGTAAHLAGPIGEAPNYVIQVLNSDWTPNSGIDGSGFLARHLPSALETAPDDWDVAHSNALSTANARRLTLFSRTSGAQLEADSRPIDSQSSFLANLSVVAPEGALVSCSNKLRFEFLNPADPDRIYLARIALDSRFTRGHAPFLCVTNLRELAAFGGYVQLPGLDSTPGTAVYGTCEIATRFQDQTPSACRFRLVSADSSRLVFATDAQVGTRIVDQVESSPALDSSTWPALDRFTNNVVPDVSSFDSGWKELTYSIDRAALAATPHRFFRLTRTRQPDS